MTQIVLALAGQPLLIVLALVLTILLVLVMGTVTWSFDLRRGRLPQATQWENLTQRLDVVAGQLAEKQAQIQEITQRIQERDRVAAEVAAVRSQLEDLKAELTGLDEGRRQVDELKRKAAEAATEYAVVSGQLGDSRHALAEAEARGLTLASEHERMTRELAAAQGEIGRLRGDVEPLRIEHAALQSELAQLREERTKSLAALTEAREIAGKIEAMRQDFVLLQRRKDAAETEFAEAERRRVESRRALDALQPEVAEARRLSGLLPELEARKAALEERIADLRGSGGPTDGGQGESDADPLADLRRLPPCLQDLPGGDRAAQLEFAAVEAVCRRLEDQGLRYGRRVVRAFHTALKINEMAQMTVLAGVSGTGKSLLPRQYAEAMGIAFLQIAVEPRWDSPQDLLGFYNYVEKRYRATDLARALVHMDPYNTSTLAEDPLGERMLLVLLDEMNLARVEYYFSEFLSRLEVRPRYRDAVDAAKRRGACLPIDISDRAEGSVNLFPSYNVLFAGTMNDDESTQALSDKVLDRGTVMQFPAPKNFANRGSGKPPAAQAGYLRFAEWRNWVKGTDTLHPDDRRRAGGIIDRLADIMARLERPFGHRLNEAILAYVANYPLQQADSIDHPLADQIEFRILPKLRGVSIEGKRTEFEELGRLIREDLHDAAFGQQFDDLVKRQQRGSGQFNWRGFDRG